MEACSMNGNKFAQLIREEIRIAVELLAGKARPETLFEQSFFDIRDKAKGL